MKPWLKISFDPSLPGTARVTGQRAKVGGQWVVFDKSQGVGGLRSYHKGALLFSSGNIADCHRYIAQQRELTNEAL
jgi:hypothetical protein